MCSIFSVQIFAGRYHPANVFSLEKQRLCARDVKLTNISTNNLSWYDAQMTVLTTIFHRESSSGIKAWPQLFKARLSKSRVNVKFDLSLRCTYTKQ